MRIVGRWKYKDSDETEYKDREMNKKCDQEHDLKHTTDCPYEGYNIYRCDIC